MEKAAIENIIFDLGGVILNLDYARTTEAFGQLGLKDFPTMYSQAAQTGLFDTYEKGLCSTPYFINALLNYLPSGTTPNKVVAAWNAMILDFPEENLELLIKLKNKHRIFLLSNTNEIHIQAVNRALAKVSAHTSLHPYFEKVYFSCEMNMRKPDAEIFEKVCTENELLPGSTIFIDDTEQHISGAQSAGLQAYHLKKGEKLTQVFPGIILPGSHQ